jgi:multidrug efflux pump subunit AcrB
MNGLIRFSLLNPRAITVLMLTIVIAGAVAVSVVPKDILPVYRSPAVQVLTFYNGMPAASVEADITSRMERWTGQAAGTRRQESRSIIGASIIRNYYADDTDPSAALTQVNSLATAAIPNLPPGTLPPVNVMTLAGLALAIGPLVDSAIICLENTHRHLGLGARPKAAAFLGASEVAMPELIASLCTLLVLLPLALMPGLGALLFKPMFLAVAFAMTIAYVLSRTFVPARCAAWLRGHRGTPVESTSFDWEHRNEHEHAVEKGAVARAFEKWESILDAGFQRYARLLDFLMVALLRSYVTPLVVLSAVPVGVTGVVLMLFFTGTALNVQSLLGVIFMVGIVVSNTVLLTEFAEHVRKTDRISPLEAIRRAAAIRVRPVMMTALATFFALIPAAGAAAGRTGVHADGAGGTRGGIRPGRAGSVSDRCETADARVLKPHR